VALDEQTAFRRSSKFAILVGIANYPKYSGISRLDFPPRDVDLIGTELKKLGYTIVSLKDQDATREAIRGTLHNLAESLSGNRNSTVIFYFSGHGWAPEGRNTLATFDAGARNLDNSGLPVAEVVAALEKSGARRRVLWIDACRDAPSTGQRSVVARSFSALDRAEGTRVFYSTKLGASSYENNELRQGVFTHFLVRGLRGEAAKSDNLLSVRDLVEYVTQRVREYSFERGSAQIPFEGGEASGDFLLGAVNSLTSTRPDPSPVETKPSPVPAVLAPAPSQTRLGANQVGQLACAVRETPRGAWTEVGDAQFLMDNDPIGTIRFSKSGSRTLRFPCTPGFHRFELRISLRNSSPIYCEQTLKLDERHRYLDFGAQAGIFGKGKCTILLVE